MTKTKDIKGLTYITDINKIDITTLTIRYTEDTSGKSLSISNNKIIFIVPFEEIEKIIKEK